MKQFWGLYKDRQGRLNYGNPWVALLTDLIGWGVAILILLLLVWGSQK